MKTPEVGLDEQCILQQFSDVFFRWSLGEMCDCLKIDIYGGRQHNKYSIKTTFRQMVLGLLPSQNSPPAHMARHGILCAAAAESSLGTGQMCVWSGRSISPKYLTISCYPACFTHVLLRCVGLPASAYRLFP